MRKVLMAVLLCAVSSAAHAAALSIANTSAPAVNCVFDPTCTILVTDTSDTIVLPGGTGSGFLQSRTYVGQPGTQAEGLYGYEYRIDLREISGTPAPSLVSFSIDFGRVVPLDYNADGVTEHVYIVTAGGLGSIGPDYADKTGNTISLPLLRRGRGRHLLLLLRPGLQDASAQRHSADHGDLDGVGHQRRCPGAGDPAVSRPAGSQR